MEAQLEGARESQRQQIQQSDAALEQFKKQVELATERNYSEMKHQVCCLNVQTNLSTFSLFMKQHTPTLKLFHWLVPNRAAKAALVSCIGQERTSSVNIITAQL